MTETPIFITGRFRSGTSFLWQLFNRLNGYCAWYEPLHPQLLSAIKYVEPKKAHVGITDYWQTYRDKPEFESCYSMKFATEQLYLEATDIYTGLESYIRHLIDLSGSEVPVLQFNRVDLRLPWLKNKFPEAKIIHIERNPLQLYYSQRKHIGPEQLHDASYWDAYELMPWTFALKENFPCLFTSASNHAFYPFFVIYQLSKKMAVLHSDVSINLDEQVFQSDEFIQLVSSVVSLSDEQKNEIKDMTHVPHIPVFDELLTDELAQIMTEVDLLLVQSGLMESFGVSSLKDIKAQNKAFWQNFNGETKSCAPLLLSINQLNSELTRILAENKKLKSELKSLTKNQTDSAEYE